MRGKIGKSTIYIQVQILSSPNKHTLQALTNSFVCSLLVVLDVEHCRSKLSSRDLSLEQDINLSVRSVLELGKAKESDDKADSGGTAPNVPTLPSEVPPGRVEHLRSD
jgi:hypothetical protein